jgi:hypothetical protein
LDEQLLLEELKKIVDITTKRGVLVRGLGATAIRRHSLGFAEKYPVLRRELTDLDLITYSRHEKRVIDVLNDCGYHQDRARAYLRKLSGRSTLENPNIHLVADLFFDKLSYNHVLSLKERLEKDPLTIPLADLFLEKMQIVQINEKDVKDVILLLRQHPLGSIDEETVNVERICRVLSEDWGFYYTVTTNLGKISEYAKNLEGLQEDDCNGILSKIDQLRNAIESSPKSLGWKMRARVGVTKKWYEDVEELYGGH